DPALYYTFALDLRPEIKLVHPNVVKNAGIENLYIERVTPYAKQGSLSQGYNIRFQATAYSWVRNVESAFVMGRHIQFAQSFRGVIRDSYVHEAHDYCPGANAFGISLSDKTSDMLVENNIGYFLNVGIVMESAGAGNVIAYNYLEGMQNCDAPRT